jgi:beta-galactosidase
VGFSAGTIKAVGSNGGRVVATHELRTAGTPAKIILAAESSRITNSAEDVVHVTVTVVDQNGIIVPNAGNLINFTLTGPGVIAAVDNGDNASHELFQGSERHAYQGTCVVMIKAKGSAGRIRLTATSPGLGPASIELAASPLGR